MSPEIAGIIGIIILLILVFMRVWIGFAMALIGFAGYMYIEGYRKAVLMVGTEPYSQISDLALTTVPLFILMGSIISNSNLGRDLYISASKWIGNLKGGLTAATVVACGIFASVCGHTSASAITIGKIAMPEMKKFKYKEDFAAGTCVAGGTIGIMIPPSLAFIIFGLLTQESIGKLFIAGVIPGVLQILFYVITIIIMSRIRPGWAKSTGEHHTFKEKVVSLKLTGPVILVFLIAIGGIYAGIFTPTEAGAMGAFGAMIIALAFRRLKWAPFKGAVLETTMSTAMIIGLIAGAYIFMRFITVSDIPFFICNTVTSLGLSKVGFMVLIVIFYLLAGCVLDVYAVIILTVPILMPTVRALGFDPIWYGVIVVRLIQIGLITPPIGLDVFTFSGVMGLKTGAVFKGVTPFFISDLIHLVLLLVIPELSLALL
ncbi:MAG: TRAP transporter large permease [Spirochaetes bacterium]|nr:TRAP transporter large permease [Spirochaetota bacterium]